jgi:hypothetical protein
MMMRKVLPFFLVAGLAVASALLHGESVSTVAGRRHQLSGQYKIEVSDNKAIIRQGKVQTEVL